MKSKSYRGYSTHERQLCIVYKNCQFIMPELHLVETLKYKIFLKKLASRAQFLSLIEHSSLLYKNPGCAAGDKRGFGNV